jgi:hypothetical protein
MDGFNTAGMVEIEDEEQQQIFDVSGMTEIAPAIEFDTSGMLEISKDETWISQRKSAAFEERMKLPDDDPRMQNPYPPEKTILPGVRNKLHPSEAGMTEIAPAIEFDTSGMLEISKDETLPVPARPPEDEPVLDPDIERIRTPLDQGQEDEFKKWYKDYSTRNQLNDNPDDPRHQYDYRGWWSAIQRDPSYAPVKGKDGFDHGPQEFKDTDHPTRWKGKFLDATGHDPDDLGIKDDSEAQAWIAERDKAQIAPIGAIPSLPQPKEPEPQVGGMLSISNDPPPGRLQTAGASFIHNLTDTGVNYPASLAIDKAEGAMTLLKEFDKIDRGENPFARVTDGFLKPDIYRYQSGNEEQRAALRQATTKMMEGVRDDPLYKVSTDTREWLREKIPANQDYSHDFWTSQLPGALGSGVGFIGQMMALRRVVPNPTMGSQRMIPGKRGQQPVMSAPGQKVQTNPVTGAIIGGGVGAGMESVMEFENILKRGGTLEQAFLASKLGMIAGATEGLPLAHLMQFVDKGTGGLITRALKNAVTEGFEETIQETFSTIFKAFNSKYAVGLDYEPNTGMFTGTVDGMPVAFSAGAIIGFLMTLVSGRRARNQMEAAPDDANLIFGEEEDPFGPGLDGPDGDGAIETPDDIRMSQEDFINSDATVEDLAAQQTTEELPPATSGETLVGPQDGAGPPGSTPPGAILPVEPVDDIGIFPGENEAPVPNAPPIHPAGFGNKKQQETQLNRAKKLLEERLGKKVRVKKINGEWRLEVEDGNQADNFAAMEEVSNQASLAIKRSDAARKRGGPVQGPMSLNDFIASRGGVIDSGGELKAMDMDKWHQGKKFRSKFIRESFKGQTQMGDFSQQGSTDDGYTLEDHWEAAVEAGYFPDMEGQDVRAVNGINRLLDAISDGDTRYTVKDQTTLDEKAATVQEKEDKIRRDERIAEEMEKHHVESFSDEARAEFHKRVVEDGEDVVDVIDHLVDAQEREATRMASSGEIDIEAGAEFDDNIPFSEMPDAESGPTAEAEQIEGASPQPEDQAQAAPEGATPGGQPGEPVRAAEQESGKDLLAIPDFLRRAAPAAAPVEATESEKPADLSTEEPNERIDRAKQAVENFLPMLSGFTKKQMTKAVEAIGDTSGSKADYVDRITTYLRDAAENSEQFIDGQNTPIERERSARVAGGTSEAYPGVSMSSLADLIENATKSKSSPQPTELPTPDRRAQRAEERAETAKKELEGIMVDLSEAVKKGGNWDALALERRDEIRALIDKARKGVEPGNRTGAAYLDGIQNRLAAAYIESTRDPETQDELIAAVQKKLPKGLIASASPFLDTAAQITQEKDGRQIGSLRVDQYGDVDNIIQKAINKSKSSPQPTELPTPDRRAQRAEKRADISDKVMIIDGTAQEKSVRAEAVKDVEGATQQYLITGAEETETKREKAAREKKEQAEKEFEAKKTESALRAPRGSQDPNAGGMFDQGPAQADVEQATEGALAGGYAGQNNPHIASSDMSDAHVIGAFYRTKGWSKPTIKKTRGHQWLINDNAHRIDGNEVVPVGEENATPVTPEPSAEGTDDDIQTLLDNEIYVGEETTASGATVYDVTGNTFPHKDIFGKSGLRGKWIKNTKAWRFKNDPTAAIAKALRGGGIDQDGEGSAGDQRGSIEPIQERSGERISNTDLQPAIENRDEYLARDTLELLKRGEQFGIPTAVIEDQATDAAAINRAFQSDLPMFLLSSEPGSGKTFVLGAAMREMEKAGAKRIVYVTMNQKLISQIERDLADYGIKNVEFVTYSHLSRNDVAIDHETILIFDEAHNVKNSQSKSGERAGDMMAASKLTVLASATPFENPGEAGYLAPTGVFGAEGYKEWSKQHGVRWKRLKMGKREIEIPIWNSKDEGAHENALRARAYFADRGMFTYRPLELPEGMVDTEFWKHDVSKQWLDLYESVDAAYDTAAAPWAKTPKFAQIMAHRANTLKRILEASKMDAAIERAQHYIKEGRQVVIFTETKADRKLGVWGRSGETKKNRRMYSYPEMREIMIEYEEEARMTKAAGGRPPKPPFAKFIEEIAAAFHSAGIDTEMPSVKDNIADKIGRDQVALYTGDETDSLAGRNLEAWRNKHKQVLIVTMAKGGTGLSLHDTVGDAPRVQIGLNLPWKATGVDQVSRRTARYGQASHGIIEWIFANNIPFERGLASKVGDRMRAMGASVKGVEVSEADMLEQFDMEAKDVETKEEMFSDIDYGFEEDTRLTEPVPKTEPPKGGSRAMQRRARRGEVKRGAEDIISRLYMQHNLDRTKGDGSRVEPEDIREIQDFIEWIGEHMLEGIGLRIWKNGGNYQGQFDLLDQTITLFRKAIDEGTVSRTMIHEMWHVMEQALTRSDRIAVVREYKKAREKWLKKNPWARAFVSADGHTLNKTLPKNRKKAWLADMDNQQALGENDLLSLDKDGNPTIRWTKETYRLANMHEFFAETMSDNYENMKFSENERVHSIWVHMRDIVRRFVQGVRRALGMGKATDRMFKDFEGWGYVIDQEGFAGSETIGDLDELLASDIEPSSDKWSNPAVEKRFQESSKGLGSTETRLQRFKAYLREIRSGFTRHFEFLPNEKFFARANEALRQLEAAPEVAEARVVDNLEYITEGLSPSDYQLFVRKVIADDLHHASELEHKLPWGMTPEDLAADYPAINAAVEANPRVQQALDRRQEISRPLKEELVEAGILDEDTLDNDAYFRHQVIMYARMRQEVYGSGEAKKPYSPYAQKRGGEFDGDINANYLEAEFEYMQRARIDLKMVETIEKIRAGYDVHKQAQVEADQYNADAFQQLVDNGEFSDAVLDDNRNADESINKIFQRNALKDRDLFHTFENHIPEGYSTWQPEKGNHFFVAKSIPEHAIDRLLDGVEEAGGMGDNSGVDPAEVLEAVGEIKEVLAMGMPKYKMVLPDDIIAQLLDMRPRKDNALFDVLLAKPQAYWKRWVLINPRRVLKYNINNMSGDLDAVIAGNPSILKRMPEAMREMIAMSRGEPATPRWERAMERGVMTSGLTIQEIPDISELDQFNRLQGKLKKKTPVRLITRAVMAAWRVLKDSTQFRENWVRYAAFIDYEGRLEAGESQESVGYGGSIPRMVDGLTTNSDKAGKLARELVGDYGAISKYGQGLRKYVWPFWAFQEINLRRYSRLLGNAWSTGVGGKARVAAILGKKGVGVTARLAIQMSILSLAIHAFNGMFWPELEDELDEEEQVRLHVILGKDDEGKIRLLRLQGALSDAMSWMGFEQGIIAWREWQSGRASFWDLAMVTPKAITNKVVSSITPLWKAPIEYFTRQTFWPDVFNPRTTPDRARHAARLFSLENEYDWLTGRPSRGYLKSWMPGAVLTLRDPQQTAYFKIRGLARKFRDKKEGATGGYGSRTTNRKRAGYMWRLAVRIGDDEAADRYRTLFEELSDEEGIKIKNSIKQTKRLAKPLNGLKKNQKEDFIDTLTEKEVQLLDRAEEWWEYVYGDL